jgi:hexosaminidase
VATSFGVSEFLKILLCAGNEKTFDFLFQLLDEVMEVFPFEYIHLGGDEAVKDEWKRCPNCQKVKKEQWAEGTSASCRAGFSAASAGI